MADNEVKIKLTVEGNAKVQLDNATQAVEDFGKQTKKSVKEASAAFETLKGVLGAQAIVGGFKAAFGAAKRFFGVMVTEGIQAAAVQEDAINQLNQALKASGQFTEETSKSLQAYASELQNSTKFGDEAILNAQALIQNLGQLDKEGLKTATKATLDLSAALGIDLTAAATLVGKAASGEVSSFTRYGLSIEKTSDKTKTFENALKAINTQFGGAAAAQINTFSGAQQQLANTFGDLQEEIGFAITKNQSMVGVIKIAQQAISGLITVFQENQGAIAEFVSAGIVKAVQGLGLLSNAVQASIVTYLKLKDAALQTAFAIVNTTNKVTGGALASAETVQKLAKAVVESEKEIAAAENSETFAKINEELFKMQAAAQAGFGSMTAGAEETESAAARIVASNEEITESHKKATEAAEKRADAIIESSKTEIEKLKEKRIAIGKDFQKGLISRKKFNNARRDIEKNIDTQRIKDQEETEKQEQNIRNQRLGAVSDMFGNLAVLSKSGNKKLATIGKIAAISQTLVDTYLGAQKAFTALAGIPIVGPGLGAAAAAAAVVGGLARVAQIRGTPLQEGITEVPGVGTRDNFPAILAPKERVVDRETNKDLKEFLKSSEGANDLLAAINDNIVSLENQVQVNIGGSTVVDTTVEASRGGRKIRGALT